MFNCRVRAMIKAQQLLRDGIDIETYSFENNILDNLVGTLNDEKS